MPLWMFVRLHAAARPLVAGIWCARRHREPAGADGLGAEAGFSTAEGLAGAALAVVALIAIWAAMRAFGLDIVRWMQDQITSQA